VATESADAKLQSRNNCVSPLYDLLNDEKNLSKLLIVKRESKELNELVKNISAVAGDRVKRLERLTKADRALDLHAMGLPAGEVATRDAAAKTKERELLQAKGADFEFKLLLSQAEALNYGAHLAKVAAENGSQPERAREFSALSEEMKRLQDGVVARLQAHQ
jgi:uncharacterized membrane protein YccC